MVETLLIAGLGNPGSQYTHTRHNIGFMVTDLLAERWGITFCEANSFDAELVSTNIQDKKVYLCQPMTFMAIIGMLGLIGMMVKNAIVLVDEINCLQTEEKVAPYTAVVEATVSRVRPVLMASLTTIVGMIPLVTDPMYSSMAITIMGGLTVGTMITLVLLPIFYTTLFHIQKPTNI